MPLDLEHKVYNNILLTKQKKIISVTRGNFMSTSYGLPTWKTIQLEGKCFGCHQFEVTWIIIFSTINFTFFKI